MRRAARCHRLLTNSGSRATRTDQRQTAIVCKPSDTVEPTTMNQHRYLILIESIDQDNLSAYAPDLPGVVATAATEGRLRARDA